MRQISIIHQNFEEKNKMYLGEGVDARATLAGLGLLHDELGEAGQDEPVIFFTILMKISRIKPFRAKFVTNFAKIMKTFEKIIICTRPSS